MNQLNSSYGFVRSYHATLLQPIANRVAQKLEIISKTFFMNQTSAYGIYD